MYTCTVPLCEDGAVMIDGGGNKGRVEVCVNNTYEPVCIDTWGTAEAAVVCRELGYRTDSKLWESII